MLQFLIGAFLLCTSIATYGDAFVLSNAMNASTVAEVFVQKNHIRVELEIGMQDVVTFKDLLPDKLYKKISKNSSGYSDRVKAFIAKDFILKADGKQLKGVLVSVKLKDRVIRDRINGSAVPVPPQNSEKVILAVLEYFYQGTPRTISIRPPIKNNNPKTEIGFIAYHDHLPINDFRYLVGEEKITLNWGDPWYSKFESKTLWRKNKAPLSVFLYIEPFEVRKEVVIRPLDIQKHWFDLGLKGKSVIMASQQDKIKQQVADFLKNRGEITIDGSKRVAVLDRVDFIKRSLNKTTVVSSKEDIPLSSATLGVIFSYPVNGLPKRVSLAWNLFAPDIQTVNSSAVDEAGGMPYQLSPGDSTLVWQNFLTHPNIPSIVNLKPPSDKINQTDAKDIVLGLLKNIYHAFDFRDESTTYDILALSTSGDLLTQIYLETQQSLRLEQQGGAKVKIKEVEIVSNDVKINNDSMGFTATCVWNVNGSVGHWGHIHQRRNEYKAIITVSAEGEQWKVTRFELLNEERL